ncbi:helix-turn-helix domain-containing protein [Metabacillus schmidteae]|uniref:helix-turn-helix domain-containing protein n=1 Tax=Metabacillus schmidteae TaxID=2730405 RepID=UPI00158F4F0C|nr:helix-turn-helix transcriptional regulator [Metabacillus schmidteae]
MKEVRVINKNFGRMLKYLRTKQGLSLRQIREMTGISESYVNRLENNGRLCPSYPVIEKLASALSVEPTDLLEVGSNKTNGGVVPLEQLLFSCEFTLDGVKTVSSEVVEQLLNLIDVINDVVWQRDTFIADIYEITEAVDELKQELNA